EWRPGSAGRGGRAAGGAAGVVAAPAAGAGPSTATPLDRAGDDRLPRVAVRSGVGDVDLPRPGVRPRLAVVEQEHPVVGRHTTGDRLALRAGDERALHEPAGGGDRRPAGDVEGARRAGLALRTVRTRLAGTTGRAGRALRAGRTGGPSRALRAGRPARPARAVLGGLLARSGGAHELPGHRA